MEDPDLRIWNRTEENESELTWIIKDPRVFAFLELTESDRSLIQDHLIEGMEFEEMADERKQNSKTIRKEYAKALDHLRGAVLEALWHGNHLRDVENENALLKQRLFALGGTMQDPAPMGDPSWLKKRIEDIPELPLRVVHVLEFAEVKTFGDLLRYKRTELLKERNMGKTGITAIEAAFLKYGFHWG